MAQSPRFKWAFPDEDVDPFYDQFVSFVNEQDASAYRVYETAQILLTTTGSVSWDALSSTLTWSSTLDLAVATTGHTVSVAPASVQMQDKAVLYVQTIRNPQTNPLVACVVASNLPFGEDYLVLAVRSGARVFWRNGQVTSADQPSVGFAQPAPAQLRGDVQLAEGALSVDRVRGVFVSPDLIGQASGTVLTLTDGALPAVQARVSAGKYAVVLRAGESVLLFDLTAGSRTQTLPLPQGSNPLSVVSDGASGFWVGSDSGTLLHYSGLLMDGPYPSSPSVLVSGCASMVFDGQSLYAANPTDGLIQAYMPSTQTLTTIPIGGAGPVYDLFSFGGSLYVATTSAVLQINKTTLGVVSVAAPEVGALSRFVFMADTKKLIVVNQALGHLYRFDLMTATFDGANLPLTHISTVAGGIYDGTHVTLYGLLQVEQITTPNGSPGEGAHVSLPGDLTGGLLETAPSRLIMTSTSPDGIYALDPVTLATVASSALAALIEALPAAGGGGAVASVTGSGALSFTAGANPVGSIDASNPVGPITGTMSGAQAVLLQALNTQVPPSPADPTKVLKATGVAGVSVWGTVGGGGGPPLAPGTATYFWRLDGVGPTFPNEGTGGNAAGDSLTPTVTGAGFSGFSDGALFKGEKNYLFAAGAGSDNIVSGTLSTPVAPGSAFSIGVYYRGEYPTTQTGAQPYMAVLQLSGPNSGGGANRIVLGWDPTDGWTVGSEIEGTWSTGIPSPAMGTPAGAMPPRFAPPALLVLTRDPVAPSTKLYINGLLVGSAVISGFPHVGLDHFAVSDGGNCAPGAYACAFVEPSALTESQIRAKLAVLRAA